MDLSAPAEAIAGEAPAPMQGSISRKRTIKQRKLRHHGTRPSRRRRTLFGAAPPSEPTSSLELALAAPAPGAGAYPDEQPAPVRYSAAVPTEPGNVAAEVIAEIGESEGGSSELELKGFVGGGDLFIDADTRALLHGLFPLNAGHQGNIVVNLQPSFRWTTRGFRLAADLSLIGNAQVAANATEKDWQALISEAYGEWRSGHVSFILGRYRLNWGSGLAASPINLLNPPVSLIGFQHRPAGAFLLPMVEFSVDGFTLSASASPPYQIDRHLLPERLDLRHPTLAVRAYTLRAGIDINLIYYRDTQAGRHALGASLSRFFGSSVEVHAEALAVSGRPDLPSLPTSYLCGDEPSAGRQPRRISALGGMRFDHSDHTSVSLEYLYNGRGLSNPNYQLLLNQLPCIKQLAPTSGSQKPTSGPLDTGLSFMRQHYAILSFHRPQLAPGWLEDIAVSAIIAYGPLDSSFAAQLGLQYQLGKTAIALSVARWGGAAGSEFALAPIRTLAILSLKYLF